MRANRTRALQASAGFALCSILDALGPRCLSRDVGRTHRSHPSIPRDNETNTNNHMNDANAKTVKVRNFSFWIIAAVLYPIAHWIPTASGHPPRIFDVLIPVLVLGLGLASNSMLAAALKKARDE